MRRRIDVAAGIAALALAALAASAAAVAGTASGAFGVRIALNGPGPAAASSAPGAPQDSCLSESRSGRTAGLVRVSCSTRRFVSIDYYLRRAPGMVEPDAGASAGGGGMITYYRVYSIDEAGGPLHMLVSF